MLNSSLNWLRNIQGWLDTDIYSTAWVALVPSKTDLSRPAWPQALNYLRQNQLADGSWGEPGITYAHGRTISTLAAVWALHAWHSQPSDTERIRRGLSALRAYAGLLADEPHEPVGFELLIPRLQANMQAFEEQLPLEQWAPIHAKHDEKIALIHNLKPKPGHQQTWWFSMEMLPDEQLAALDDSILDAHGAIATSTAATAAYLRAKRLNGEDSPRAAQFLSKMLAEGHGGVPVGWPFDVFERIWVLDSFMRVDMDPFNPHIQAVAQSVWDAWHINQPGLAYGDTFEVNDGDDTLVGFATLNWAGFSPSEEAILSFWDTNHFRSYVDERTSSVSVNLHALTALRTQPGFPHRDLAQSVTKWLAENTTPRDLLEDKWHLSPYYSVSHAVPAFAGLDNAIARQCVNFLLGEQRKDGGWGFFEHSTLEETSHCVIALYQAAKHNLLNDLTPLQNAAQFFGANEDQHAAERLWIGKSLYRPEAIVRATLQAARVALYKLRCDVHTQHEVAGWLAHAAPVRGT